MKRLPVCGSWMVFLFVVLGHLFETGCARPGLKQSLVAMRAPEGSPMLLAIYQPWFGNGEHINVGYSCHDPVVLRQQIARAKELNIQGFVVNWYGERKPFEDQALTLLARSANESGFKVAVQYDEAADRGGATTDVVITELQYLYDRHIGPKAGGEREAYLRYGGRPVIFIFPKTAETDWNRVRRETQSWAEPPLLIYKDQNEKFPGAFDGYYAWVQPGKGGWAADGSNWGEDYLDYFYKNMTTHFQNKIAVGAVWPGFDDSQAAWGLNRKIAYRCGKTFEDGLRVFRKYYGTENAPPYLLIETWNDYEEGTAVERGISHCSAGQSGGAASPGA